jgi:DNA-binding LacI/PurR family transcriptional regulator
MALRNHPDLPETTKSRLRSIAEEMGYRPDPLLSALNAYRIENRRRSFQGVIAWVDPVPMRYAPRRLSGFAGYWSAISARCEALGFVLEEFRLRESGMNGSKLSRILRDRGINGIVVAPLHAARGHVSLHWDWFSAISLSYSLAAPDLHTFVPAQYSGVAEIMRRLRRLGYRRPGIVIGRNEHERTDRLRLAAYHAGLMDFSVDRPILPFLHEEGDSTGFPQWIALEKPDVVIGQHGGAYEWLLEMGVKVPEQIGFVGVAVPHAGIWSGQVEDLELLGTSAVNWLDGMIRRGELGVPAKALRVLIPPDWKDGATLKMVTNTGSRNRRPKEASARA